jgi:hypothetical protein
LVAGLIVDGSREQDSFLAALDVASGAIEWAQEIEGGGVDEAFWVDSDASHVFTGGAEGCNADLLACTFVVRAHDIVSGSPLWEDRLQAAPGKDAFTNMIVAGAGQVFTCGAAQAPPAGYEWVVRAYDSDSGSLAWEDGFHTEGVARALALRQGQLVVAGLVGAVNGNPRVRGALRAYQVTTE